MPELIVMPHWSATRFMLYDQCPGEFKARYVDGVPLQPTEALCFGKAVHMGLEAHYQGEDGERAFKAAWKTMAAEDLAGQVNPGLTAVGLTLIDEVVDLGLEGIPERGFSLDTNQDLGAPIVGAIDLWDAEHNIVYDFKTTIGAWSQQRAQKETWQPLIYTSAFWEETEQWPAFEYVVLNRSTGQLDRFRREWDHESWLQQMGEAYDRMLAISQLVRAGDLRCHGQHGFCPECGDRWTHAHTCERPAPLTTRRAR